MTLPIVAIVGRPNVGKSSLLNSLAGENISIVEPTAGVTRDRVSVVVDLDEKYFELVDTGGYGIEDHDDLTEHVEAQIKIAIDRADIVLFVVDVREGVTPLDQEVAQLLRRPQLRVLLVANKADSPAMDDMTGEFFALGFGQPLTVSAQHGRNRQELVERILEELEGCQSDRPQEIEMKLAVVGRRNVGKSTFINNIAGEDRVIVSEVPGTTRDAIDVRFEKDGQSFVAIDTAGVRKKSQMIKNSIDFYSYTRATRSIRRADVVLFFMDAIEPVSQVDKKLARFITDEYKPCVIVINKWDMVIDQTDTQKYGDYLDEALPGLGYAPISFITASEGKNVPKLLELAKQLYKQSTTSVTTSRLNKALKLVTSQRAPSARRKTGLPRIYYGTQVGTQPPTLLLFVNNPSAIDDNYRRYLISHLREILPFSEVPIRLLLRHHRGEGEDL